MFSYNVAKNADQRAFDRICAVIESRLRGIEKLPVLIDVDGTQIQIYNTQNGKIKVVNDYEVDAVYIDSDVRLDGIDSAERMKTDLPAVNSVIKVKYIGEDDPLVLSSGKIYEARVLKKGWLGVVDETKEEYAYPPELFVQVRENP